MSYPVKFGKYLLLERVNVGGMAKVFKAKTFGVAGFERILAIKRILPTLVEDDEFIRMFIDEARIAVQLNHANIAQIYELGKHGEHYYIAMEYLASKDLRGILDKMRMHGQLMPIPQAAYVISKVCEGLDYAHRRRDPAGNPMNIIHRDVSPQNILISFEGEVKLIDFGIAKAANRASKTQAGVLKGKFGYMSPEQVRGLPIDRRSDIFAVGVLLYEMLTGERLFIGESDFSTLERVRNAEVVPPTTFNKKISPELEQIVLKSLAREVEDRYQWASELAEDLTRFLIEDRSIYSAKRLAAYMKETYSSDIAAEREKMEEYLKLDESNLAATGGDAAPMAPAAPPKKPPPPPPMSSEGAPVPDEDRTEFRPDIAGDSTAAPGDGIDYDEVEFEGEDKTFVIEASDAGMALQAGSEPSSPAGDPAARPPGEPTNDDFLNDPSLYGDDDLDDDDDAKTEVSFENPFDENPSQDAPSVPPPATAPPQISTESAPMPPAKQSISTANPISPGGRVHSDDGLDPVAAAMAEDMSGDFVPPGAVSTPPTPPPATPPPAAASPAPPPDPSALDQPTEDTRTLHGGESSQTAPVNPAPGGKKKGLGTGAIVGIGAGLFLSFAALVSVGGYAIYKLTRPAGGPTAPADGVGKVALQAAGAVPKSLTVTLDGNPVGDKLPLDVEVPAGGPHTFKVSADGYTTFSLTLPTVAAGSKVPLFVVLSKDPSAGVQVASNDDKGSKGEKADKTPPPPDDPPKDDVDTGGEKVAKNDASPPSAEDKPDEGDAKPDDAASDDAKSGDAADGDGDGDPALANNGAPNAGGEPWRVSFATIAEADGALVNDAEVFMDGKRIGKTPFEAEFPAGQDKVALQIKADGFAARTLEIQRKGRALVGPGTVRLGAPAAAASATGDGAGDGSGEGDKVAMADTGDGSGDDAPKDADDTSGDAAAEDPPASEPDPAPEAKPKEDKKVASARERRPPPRRRARSERRRSKPKPKPKKRSTLAVGTQPPSEVWVDRVKQPRGTPLMGKFALKLTEGTHWMTFKDKMSGKKYRYKVTLGADSRSNKLIIFLGQRVTAKGHVRAVQVK